jgi:hypothetical protein
MLNNSWFVFHIQGVSISPNPLCFSIHVGSISSITSLRFLLMTILVMPSYSWFSYVDAHLSKESTWKPIPPNHKSQSYSWGFRDNLWCSTIHGLSFISKVWAFLSIHRAFSIHGGSIPPMTSNTCSWAYCLFPIHGFFVTWAIISRFWSELR